MPGQNYYLLSFLPALGELGSAASMTMAELLAYVRQADGPGALIEAVALGEDLRQRESYLSGETTELELAVLSEQQGKNEAPLPDYLVREQEMMSAISVDKIWQSYFYFAAETAQRQSSEFLQAWVGREVALRNGLAAARAKTLQLPVEQYLAAEDLADEDVDLAAVLSEWSAAESPLAGLLVLERDRWGWLSANEKWFSFGDDELAVYAAKLMTLRNWQRVAEAKPSDAPAKTINET